MSSASSAARLAAARRQAWRGAARRGEAPQRVSAAAVVAPTATRPVGGGEECRGDDDSSRHNGPLSVFCTADESKYNNLFHYDVKKSFLCFRKHEDGGRARQGRRGEARPGRVLARVGGQHSRGLFVLTFTFFFLYFFYFIEK